MIDMNINNK